MDVLQTDHSGKNLAESIFRPFDTMTNNISTQHIPTISLDALIYVEMYNHLEACNNVTTDLGWTGTKPLDLRTTWQIIVGRYQPVITENSVVQEEVSDNEPSYDMFDRQMK
ncbi:unnamed protein product [Allacma fusca]|uniref:Uncharacterized protein n=1 Tax=Allacma fusca TaxID=39272 RepID=A0A8J2KGT8_9HEXA|nr:unnamed protein product [Allacma fusca]